MQPITPASPGQPLRASDINAQSSELRRQGNTFFEGGTLSQEAGGVHLSADAPSGFFAMITGRDGYNYGKARSDMANAFAARRKAVENATTIEEVG